MAVPFHLTRGSLGSVTCDQHPPPLPLHMHAHMHALNIFMLTTYIFTYVALVGRQLQWQPSPSLRFSFFLMKTGEQRAPRRRAG